MIHGFVDSLICWFIDSSLSFLESFIRWFIDSLVYGLVDSLFCYVLLIHCLIDSLNDCFIACNHWLIDSLLRSFVDSLIHCFVACLLAWFLDSLIEWVIGWLIDWFDPSIHLAVYPFICPSIHPSIHSFILPSIDWLSDWLILASLIHCFIGSLAFKQLSVDSSCHFIGISATICLFVDAPHNFNTSLLLHLKHFPIGSYRSYRQSSSYTVAVSVFWTLPSRGVPGTIW